MKISKASGIMLLNIMNQLTKNEPEENAAAENVYAACENLEKVLSLNLCDLPPIEAWSDEPLVIGSASDGNGMVKIEPVPNNALVYSLNVQTEAGGLQAYACGDKDYPGMYLCYKPEGADTEIDLALAETHEGPDDPEPEGVDVYVWEDAYQEDWTNKFTIRKADAKEAIEE